MSRIEEIDKIVDEIGDADSLYEFAEVRSDIWKQNMY